ncbi:MAG: TIGR01212 family radical SAM protein [Clostridia bacterium]|nr:TIGR01212 family radical SAM protein [Clostridia bacterium]
MEKPYYSLSEYLKGKFGERVYKISVNGGFTCPNRDGKKGVGGCIFCNEQGSGEHTLEGDITRQMEDGIAFAKAKNKGNKYIAYFQNFTSTYAPVNILRQKYAAALVNEKVVGLAVATRPDCIDEDVVKVIKEVANNRLAWVELGLQTANENTAKIINRQYSNAEFTAAVKLLNEYNIPVVVHLIVGLPNENFSDILNTVKFLNDHKIDGIKIHSLFVLKNTPLEKLYLGGKYTPIDRDFYIKCVAEILARIPKNVVVHRLTGDGDKLQILAPQWTMEKKKNLNAVYSYMVKNNLTQGCNCTK